MSRPEARFADPTGERKRRGEEEEDEEEEEEEGGEESKERSSSLLPFIGELTSKTWFVKIEYAFMVLFVVGDKPAEAEMTTMA